MNLPLGEQLERHLKKDHRWFSKGELTRLEWKRWSPTHSMTKTFLPETVGRALRDLEENKIVAVKYEGKNTLYKWLPQEFRSKYIPTSERVGDKLFKE